MLCPSCHFDNIAGAEYCEQCGADLSDLALPSADTEFEEHITKDKLGGMSGHDALFVAPRDPVALAIHFMRRNEVECVLVKDGDEIVGILSERDILLKAAGARVDLNALAVREIMTKDPVMLRDEDTLAVAIHKMSIGGFRHIPFVTDDGVTQLISVQDVFKHVAPYIHG